MVQQGCSALNRDHTVEKWLALLMEFGRGTTGAWSLDEANTGKFRQRLRRRASIRASKRPFIVVSGHDLEDLAQLRADCRKGDQRLHAREMLPAHGLPRTAEIPASGGKFRHGLAEPAEGAEGIPAPILFTTNCLMPPRPSYRDCVYTTSVVGYEACAHRRR